MKAHIKFNEFKKCNEESPKESGYYVVVQVDEDDGSVFNVMNIHFTLEHGWNTHVDYWDARIRFEERDNAFWGTISAYIQTDGDEE